MTRVLALILFCIASLTAGVVLATPALATVFQTHHVPARHVRGLWDWSVSGGTTTATTQAHTAKPSHPASHAHKTGSSLWWPVVVTTTTTPAPTTTTPTPTTTSTPPASTGTGDPDPTPTLPPLNPAFTLKSVDARCFDAPTAPGGWPFAPTTAVHPIRGSFDEPRSPVHIGVDVEAPRDQAPVFAMQTGRVTDATPDHFNVVPTHGAPGAYLQYWHVHISEHAKGCGLIDPARPEGLLADPDNTEWPSIGPLSAMVGGPPASRDDQKLGASPFSGGIVRCWTA